MKKQNHYLNAVRWISIGELIFYAFVLEKILDLLFLSKTLEAGTNKYILTNAFYVHLHGWSFIYLSALIFTCWNVLTNRRKKRFWIIKVICLASLILSEHHYYLKVTISLGSIILILFYFFSPIAKLFQVSLHENLVWIPLASIAASFLCKLEDHFPLLEWFYTI